ncbi:restriction endonuclease subunit S [Vibrio harveyi]|uniref:restriction endonuclease subunit S n=1 Tax=Vibrio harveyi TaxID=669 RepID=UPI00041DB2AE|nr:restriction endonuclease subunit S [Vibrio harveyi]
MSWPLETLGSVINFIRGITFKPTDIVPVGTDNSIVVMRTKNVQIAGLDCKDLIAVPQSFMKRDEQKLRNGDMLISSANSWELVGKTSYISNLGYEATAGGFISIIRAKEDKVDSKYLYYWLTSPSIQHKIRYCGKQTTNISNLDVSRFKDLEIPLPPLDEQRRIVSILDKADVVLRKRKRLITLADELVFSVFYKMFGDPVSNYKGWDIESLVKFGAFKNGLNFSANESGEEIHCIGVGDFKARDRIEDIDSLSKLQLDKLPDDSYLLKDNDLLFVRSNGNRALVGRCLTVHLGEQNVTYSGFCIRYRISDTSRLNADYLNYCMRMPSMKRAMLSGGQGANIQNISQKTLSSLGVPIPPIEVQNQFSKIVGLFRLSGLKRQQSLKETEDLFLSISQKAFRGRL